MILTFQCIISADIYISLIVSHLLEPHHWIPVADHFEVVDILIEVKEGLVYFFGLLLFLSCNILSLQRHIFLPQNHGIRYFDDIRLVGIGIFLFLECVQIVECFYGI